MATSAGAERAPSQWTPEPSRNVSNDQTADGVSIRPMRLKVLYTFDDQNKTNCLARGQDVLQIQTVALDETTSIGILDLKTCIEAVIQCSPELVNRLGQDYTVYAYDYSEYDNPLVGQGMLSKALAVASPAPNLPAQQSTKLITGRVCKNILGIFNNGVKETLEVKLRLVPVPTVMQGEYVNTMEKYREMNSSLPLGYDHHEWTKFLQSNPNMAQMTSRYATPASTSAASNHRGSMNMEVVSQLLSPSLSQQPIAQSQPVLIAPKPTLNANATTTSNVDSGNESRGGTKSKKTSRPSSRTTVKRPRAKRQPKAAATNVGGNTSGYEEGTDGDDGPVPRKRAKTTQAAWSSKSSFGPSTDSLRVAASTAGSLRLFRPIAMSAAVTPAAHLEEVPRPPTPLPNLPNHQAARSQSNLRRDSYVSQNEPQRLSPYPQLAPPVRQEDQVRVSIESANTSPERNYSPGVTPPDIASSPPVIRMRSSPPCPSSPVLPQMPRTDSGFMSGPIDELFGDGFEPFCAVEEEPFYPAEEDLVELPQPPPPQAPPSQEPPKKYKRPSRGPRRTRTPTPSHAGGGFIEQIPGPMDLLPTKMSIFKPAKVQLESVMSEDGQLSLPPLRRDSQPPSRHPTPSRRESDAQPSPTSLARPHDFQPPQAQTQEPVSQNLTAQQAEHHPSPSAQPPSVDQQPPTNSTPTAVLPRSNSRMVRTASAGSLTLPTIPASESALPPSKLQRSQTWSETPQVATKAEAPAPNLATENQMIGRNSTPGCEKVFDSFGKEITGNTSHRIRKAALKQKLEEAIANGEMPPYCCNCGAIETPVWRKAWSQNHQGVPPYYNFSDEPGQVTTIVILTRDANNQPTSYQIVKKYLGKDEDQRHYSEFHLCNPCGIWLSKYKFHRPEANWESTKEKAKKDGPPPKRKPVQRRPKPSKSASEANFPPSEAYFPQSEANYPQSEAAGPLEGISPADTTGDMQVRRMELPANHLPAIKLRPSKRLNPMTSDAASAALRRAIQSSPARWNGARNSPMDAEDDADSTRRVLFPSPPRKDGSALVLGELTANATHLSPSHRSKNQMVDVFNKENCPPALNDEDADAELLKLFEEELARPSTPVQSTAPPHPFKTPTRPTPNHRPITRSVSRSIRSSKSARDLFNLPQRTPSKTPTRRSPRNHESCFTSPFTAGIQQMMSEAHNNFSPSGTGTGVDMAFDNLPDIPLMDDMMAAQGAHSNIEFNLEDFFSTDVPMPSSPPGNFHLYEDPNAMANIDWSAFNTLDAPQAQGAVEEADTEVAIKEEETEELEEVDMVVSSP